MKRAVGLIMVFVSLFCLFSCGKKTTAEEINKKAEESAEELSVSVSEREEKASEAADDAVDEIGKTKKNKQIVAKLVYSGSIYYDKIVFDDNGIASYKIIYKYCETDSQYNLLLSYGDNGGDGKLIEKDADVRLLVYKSTDVSPLDYETFYSLYERKNPDICTIIK